MTIRPTPAVLAGLALLLPTTALAQYQDWEQAEDSSAGYHPAPQPDESAAGEPGEGTEPAEANEPAVGESDAEPAEDEGQAGTGLAGTVLLWGEVASFVGTFDVDGVARIDGVHLSPMVGGSYYFTDDIRANAQLGVATWIHDEYVLAGGSPSDPPQEGGVAFRFGNGLLSADLVGDDPDLRHRIGVGVTLPFATTNDAAETGALLLSLAERGGWDPWLWAPERLSLVATGQLELDVADDLVAAGDAGVAVLFWAGDGDGETVLAAQLAGNLEYRLDALAVGARLTAVIADELLPARKDFQLGLMPYGRLALGEATFVTLGFHLNLIAPFGFSFQEGKAWGLRVGVGAAL